jgi:hypothetical protein
MRARPLGYLNHLVLGWQVVESLGPPYRPAQCEIAFLDDGRGGGGRNRVEVGLLTTAQVLSPYLTK